MLLFLPEPKNERDKEGQEMYVTDYDIGIVNRNVPICSCSACFKIHLLMLKRKKKQSVRKRKKKQSVRKSSLRRHPHLRSRPTLCPVAALAL